MFKREEYRREFLGVSHELKTPLFTVQGYISTLLDGAMEDKVIRKKYLKRAEKGVERLIYIVEFRYDNQT
jgi:two-component system phosphate regulon sensor histidine kinase PhoR